MGVAIGIVIGWVVIVVIGHGSVVILKFIWNAVTMGHAGDQERVGKQASRASSDQHQSDQESQPLRRKVSNTDRRGFRRTVDELWRRGLIAGYDADRMREVSRKLELLDKQLASEQSQPESSVNDNDFPSAEITLHSAQSLLDERQAAVEDDSSLGAVRLNDQEIPKEEPILATVCEIEGGDAASPSPEDRPPRQSVIVPPVPSQPTPVALPGISRSEMLQSFLEAHNIRWGELVAGLLIVVCSIGLVVSLWGTLTAQHRVVPSLIFLGGNAAIFAAGMYTLSRWKLRHTSRAVLVIATLLVPLSVLAGVIAGSRGDDQVTLSDPMTIIAIVIGGVVYLALLSRSSLALVGRHRRWFVTAAVALPTMMLPFMPAIFRSGGSFVSWAVLPASIGLFVSLVGGCGLDVRRKQGRQSRGSLGIAKIGPVGMRNRFLHLGVGLFSLIVVVGFSVLLHWDDKSTVALPLAISVIPALVAAATVAGVVSRLSKSASLAAASTVAASIFIACAGVILVPAVSDAAWLWKWAAACTLSGIGSAIWLRQTRLFALTTVPLGIALTMTSIQWLGGQTLSETSIWRSLLGGEPMVASAGMGCLVALLAILPDRIQNRRWTTGVAIGWWTFSVAIAAVLTLWSAESLGVVSPIAVGGVLSVAVIASVFASLRHVRIANLVAPLGLLAIASITRPIDLTDAFQSLDLLAATITVLIVGITLPLLVEILRHGRVAQVIPKSLVRSHGVSRASRIWHRYAVGLIVFSGLLATFAPEIEMAIRQVMLGVASAVTLWVAARQRDSRTVVTAQLLAAGCVVLVSVDHFADWLLPSRDLNSWAVCLWSWILVSCGFSGLWLGLRELSHLRRGPTTRWLAGLKRPNANVVRSFDGAVWLVAVALFAILVIWQYGLLHARTLGSDVLSIDVPVGLSLCAVASLAAVAVWLTRHLLAVSAVGTRLKQLGENLQSSKATRHWALAFAVVMGVWVASEVSLRLFADASQQLIAATSLMAAFCLIAMIIKTRVFGIKGFGSESHLLVWSIALGTFSLLLTGWVIPLIRGLPVHLDATVAVVTWLMLGAVGLFVVSRFGVGVQSVAHEGDGATEGALFGREIDGAGHISALLTPLSVFLLSPVFTELTRANWVQLAAIGSGIWLACSLTLSFLAGAKRNWELTGSQGGIELSRWWVMLIGFGSAIAAAIGVIVSPAVLPHFGGWVACVSSGLAVAVCYFRSRRQSADAFWLSPGIMLSIVAAQIAWMGLQLGFYAADQLYSVTMIAISAGMVVSLTRLTAGLFRDFSGSVAGDFGHVAVASVLLTVLSLTSHGDAVPAFVPFLGIAAAGLLGVIAVLNSDASIWRQIISRFFGWATLTVGGFVLMHRVWQVDRADQAITLWIGWIALWATAWTAAIVWKTRVCVSAVVVANTPEESDAAGRSGSAATAVLCRQFATAEKEAVVILVAAGIAEMVLTLFGDVASLRVAIWNDGLLWTRLAIGVAGIATSLIVRGNLWIRQSLVAGVTAWIALFVLRAGEFADASEFQSVAATVVTGSLACLVMAVTGSWLVRMTRQLRTCLCGSSDGVMVPQLGTFGSSRLTDSVWPTISAVAICGLIAAVWMIASVAPVPITYLTISSMIAITAALAVLAERLRGSVDGMAGSSAASVLRDSAMVAGMIAIGLFASVNVGGGVHPWLAATMRWLLAGVFVLPMVLFVLPAIMRPAAALRWKKAFHGAAAIAVTTTAVALLSMLGIEAFIRDADGISDLSRLLVFSIAGLLGCGSLSIAAVAVLSGPRFSQAFSLDFSDRVRKLLVVASQVVAGLAWLHLFFCFADFAFLVPRAYWPYIVMSLAFLSVGVTEFARRMNDVVLADTLRHTALYLPLIPVVGFWFSGAGIVEDATGGWFFGGGVVSYAVLLFVGAAYYIGVSFLWKNSLSRVAGVVLGNLGLWVVLTQSAGWAFLVHPQAWLIPPIVCILVVTHCYRKRLAPAVLSAVRYACTLVLYVSSTADMLIADVGESLWGPIILIVLALIGMASGVAFRVKPFLYLGAAFVLVAVISMVSHAHQVIGATWPWWVFGITTGLGLLAGLMAIEKNKPKLQRLVGTLKSWES